MHKSRIFIAGFVALCAIAWFTAKGRDKTPEKAEPTATRQELPFEEPLKKPPEQPYKAPISETAFQPIPKSEKKLFRAWKQAGVARIDAATKGAVELASLSPQCDQVDISGLDYDRSAPPDDIAVFAMCRNGERFNFSEKEALSAPAAPTSVGESVASLTDTYAFKQCEDLVKPTLQFPSTMDASWLDSSVDRQQYTANVALAFEAKNGLGAMLPYLALCVVNDKQARLVSVKPR